MPRINSANSRQSSFSTSSVTTNTFNDLTDISSLVNNPNDLSQIIVPFLPLDAYKLTLTLTELLIPKSSTGGKIPRPQNAFMLFRKDFTANIKLTSTNTKKLRVQEISQRASD